MGCVNFLTDEHDKLLAVSVGKTCEIDPEILEGMPEVEKAIAQRCVECLEENVENTRSELKERIVQEKRTATDLERLDLEVQPTEKEYQEIYNIGRSIGMQPWQVINTPTMIGIKDPETLERMPDMKEKIKDEMINLHNSKLSPKFRDIGIVSTIMFIDKNEPGKQKGKGAAGKALGKGGLVSKPVLSSVAHVFRDPYTGKFPEGQRMHRVTIHEICHLNLHKSGEFKKVFTNHSDECKKACVEQISGPYAVTEYAARGYKKGGALNPEFIAEHVAHWDADLGVEICPEMKDFFDKYLT